MTPCTWFSVVRFIQHAHRNAYWSTDAYTDWLSASIDRQAHAALCRELRDLAARIREAP